MRASWTWITSWELPASKVGVVQCSQAPKCMLYCLVLPSYINKHSSLNNVGVSVLVKSPQSCRTLSKTMDCSWPGSSVLGILPTRIPGWAVMPCSRTSFLLTDRTMSPAFPALAGRFFTTSTTWEALGGL